ncbi:hypothetical protein EGJ34_15695 [Stenotrophomonas sp. 278]|nr:hypothetical protein EGJ34_15695 [Stenotrophomonas sp. 278]
MRAQPVGDHRVESAFFWMSKHAAEDFLVEMVTHQRGEASRQQRQIRDRVKALLVLGLHKLGHLPVGCVFLVGDVRFFGQ